MLVVICQAVVSKPIFHSAKRNLNYLFITQAELDDMSGTLHCEEGDYKTSFSYFLESYEAFDSQDDPRALRSLKVRIKIYSTSNTLNKCVSSSLIAGELMCF